MVNFFVFCDIHFFGIVISKCDLVCGVAFKSKVKGRFFKCL